MVEELDQIDQVDTQDPPKKSKILYDAVSKNYDLGSYDEFEKKLQDPTKRKAFYDGVGSKYDLGTFQEFEDKVAPVKKKEFSAFSVGQSNVPSDSKIPLVDLSSKHKFLSGVFDVADENTPEPTQPAKQTSFFQGLANTLQKGKQEIDRRNDPVIKTKNAQDFVKNLLQEKGINIDVDKEMDNPNLAPELGVLYNDTNKELEGQLSDLKQKAHIIFDAQGLDALKNPQFQQLQDKINELGTKKSQLSEHVSFLLGQQLAKNPDTTPKEIGKTIREVIQPENKTVREQMFGDKLLTKEQIESRDFNDEFNGISAKQDAVINDYRNGKLDEATAHAKMNDLSTQFNTIEKRYPTVAVDALRNIIGDRIAEYRKNNDNPLEKTWHGIITAEAGPMEIKGAIEELKKSGVEITPDQEKQIFESKEKIPLTSALGNFYHNFILNPANKLSNIFQSPFSPSTDNSEREKEFRNANALAPTQGSEQAQIADIGNGKKVVRMGANPEAGKRSDVVSWGTLNNMAQTAGTIGSYITANRVLGGGVGLLGAGKTATSILGNISASTFLNYDDYKKSAQEQGAGEGMQNVYAFGRSIVDGLLFSEFSLNKIKSVEPAIEKKITDEFMTKFSDGSFDKSKLADWIVSTSKDLGKNISIVKAQQLSGIVADKLLNPQKNEDRNATDELMSNIPADIISVLPFSAMSGYHTTAEKAGKIRQAVSMATADPAKFEDRMNELVSEGKIKESDAKEKIDYINNLAQKAKHPDLNTPKTQNLSPQQRQDYAHSLVTEETLKKQGEGLTDQVQKADVTDNIKQELEFRKSTLLKSEIADKDYKELSDAEKAKLETPKDYGNVKTQPSGTEGKFTPIIINPKGEHEVLNKSFDSADEAKVYGENKLKQRYFEEHIANSKESDTHIGEPENIPKPIELNPNDTSKTKVSEIDLSGKTSDEIYGLAKQVKEKMRSDEDEILGDKAKEYRQAKMNGDTAKIDEIENSLTPQQADKFFGKGQAALEPQEITNLGQKVSIVEQAENVNDLAQSSKQALIDLSNGRNEMQSKAILEAVKKKATELGIDTNELTQEALRAAGNNFSDKADAVDVLSNLFKPKVQENEETKNPQIPNPETGSSDTAPPTGETPLETKGTEEEPKVTSIKNEIVDKEREKRGLAPAFKAAKKEFGETWNNAMKVIEDNPEKAQELVTELKRKARPLSDEENAILLHRQIELQNAYDKVNNAINAAAEKGDNAGIQENRLRLAGISDALQDVYNVGRAAGTENARGLATRQILAKEDFSLAAMETKKRAANSGRELTDEERAHIEGLSNKIKDLEAKLEKLQKDIDEGKVKSTGKKTKKSAADFKSEREKISDSIKDKLKKSRGEAGAIILPYAKELIAIAPDVAKYIKSLVEEGVTKFDEVATRLFNELKPHIPDITENDAKDLIRGKYDQPLKQRVLSPEELKIKADIERNKQNFRTELEKDRLKNAGVLEKGLNFFVKWERAFKLSRAATLAKLSMAAIYRMGFTPVEEGIGAAWSAALPKALTDHAYREAGFNAKAEARALTQQFTQGMKDAAATINFKKGGKSDLEVLYGKEGTLPPEAADFLGHLHGAIKAPIKRAEFERSFEKRSAAMIAAGIDVTDPLVQTSIAASAYKDANRSIFMQDNLVSEGWNRVIRAMEQSKVAPNWGKAGAAIAKFLVPFVKVPTNIVGETITYTAGLPAGLARLGFAVSKGLENVSPEEKDIILRTLKKGSIGTAFLLLGYFNPQAVGGYDTGKRKDSDVDVGGLRLWGWDVPKWLVHNPLMETLQIGATIRRVSEEKNKNIGSGIMASMLGLSEEVPFVQTGAQLNKLMGTDQDRQDFLGRMAENTLIPGIVQEAAKWTDSNVKRKPENIEQNIEMGIPGLIKNVPYKRSYTNEDRKIPEFKYFVDKGLDLPYSSAKQIEINNPKTGVKSKLSEYPEEKINQYYDTKKQFLQSELKDIEKNKTVYVDRYGEASTTSGEYKTKTTLDKLNDKQLADILSIASRNATEKTKKKIFNQ